MMPRYERPKTIAIDIDGTLYCDGNLNDKLVAWVKRMHKEGYEIIVWSSRGKQYAKDAAIMAGIDDIADAIISKPGYVCDDKGWEWIKFTTVVWDID